MSPQIQFPYRQIFWIVIAFWWAAMIAVVGASWWIQPSTLLGLDMSEVMSISLASGGVAIAAILPGISIGVPIQSTAFVADSDQVDPDDDSDLGKDSELNDRGDLSRASDVAKLGNAFFVGMMIRLAGTVALFLTSSYYLDASSETTSNSQIAAWILGWHLALLAVEVIALNFKINS